MNEIMEKMVKDYLEEEAKKDELFKAKYQDENKTLEKCINYIFGRVKKGNNNILHHTDIFRFARDYYNDDVEDEEDNSVSCKVVGENDAEDYYLEQFKVAKPTPKPTPVVKPAPKPKKEEKKKDYEQISLF